MSDINKTMTFINVCDVITEESIRRQTLADMCAANARTKLWLAHSCEDKVKKLSLVREARLDILDGMSILDCGRVRPLGTYLTPCKS